MGKVTINCDMGEAFGIYSFGDDEACMPLHHPRQRRVRLPRFRSGGDVEDRPRRQEARDQGRLASRPAGSRRIRPARDEDDARGGDRARPLSDRSAEGVPRRREHAALAHQAAWRAVWNGATRRDDRRRYRRGRSEIRSSGHRLFGLRDVRSLYPPRRSLQLRVLCRSRLRRSRSPGHHQDARPGRAARPPPQRRGVP